MNDSTAVDIPQQERLRLHRRSNAKGALQLAAHAVLLLALGHALGSSWGTIGLWLALPAYAIALIFLFAPLHESIHRTVFEARRANDALAAVLGFLLLLPSRYFRAFHLAHHRRTQRLDSDPELLRPRPATVAAWAWHVSGLPLWRGLLGAIWRHAHGHFDAHEIDGPRAFVDEGRRAALVAEARWHLAGYALIALLSVLASNAFAWWYWLLPLLIGQPFLRLFLLAEHYGCDDSDDMLANSRTTYTTPLLGFLCWNMCYHAEHHYLPAVPFHALPALHAWTGARVTHRGDGYLRVNREIFAGLK